MNRIGRMLGRESLRFFVLEAVVVVFSVLVALGLDEWREERELRAQAEEAMAAVVAEVRVNREELDSARAADTRRRARVQRILDRIDGTTAFADLYTGGYRTPDPRRSAWERANAPRIAERIPPDFLDSAFELYRMAEVARDLDQDVERLVYSPVYHRPEEAAIAGAVADALLKQLVIWTNQFIPEYDAFLAAWGHLAPG